MRIAVGLVMAGVGLGLLVGCATKLPVQPMSFLLDPGPMPLTWAGRSPSTVSVTFVDVAAPYGGTRFVYRLSRDEWEFDPYNGFLISPAEMFTGVLREAVSGSRIFREVRLPGDMGAADVLIEGRVAELFADFRDPGRPEAVITMEFQVYHREEGKRVQKLARSYSQRVSFGEPRPGALVSAWNEGLRLILSDALRDVAQSGG